MENAGSNLGKQVILPPVRLKDISIHINRSFRMKFQRQSISSNISGQSNAANTLIHTDPKTLSRPKRKSQPKMFLNKIAI